MMFYVEDYFTDEIIDTFATCEAAISFSKQVDGSLVTDENDNVYYTNIELPF